MGFAADGTQWRLDLEQFNEFKVYIEEERVASSIEPLLA
jgi:hypothetical protein